MNCTLPSVYRERAGTMSRVGPAVSQAAAADLGPVPRHEGPVGDRQERGTTHT